MKKGKKSKEEITREAIIHGVNEALKWHGPSRTFDNNVKVSIPAMLRLSRMMYFNLGRGDKHPKHNLHVRVRMYDSLLSYISTLRDLRAVTASQFIDGDGNTFSINTLAAKVYDALISYKVRKCNYEDETYRTWRITFTVFMRAYIAYVSCHMMVSYGELSALSNARNMSQEFNTKIQAAMSRIRKRGYPHIANRLESFMDEPYRDSKFAWIQMDYVDGKKEYAVISHKRVTSKLISKCGDVKGICEMLSNSYSYNFKTMYQDYVPMVTAEHVKPIRLVRSMVGDTYFDANIANDSALMDCLNEVMSLDIDTSKFEIVTSYERDLLVSAYDSDYYTADDGGGSTLYDSCMRDDFDYIYFYNDSGLAGITILYNAFKEIAARAITWKSVSIFSRGSLVYCGPYLDRVYSIDDTALHAMYKYASEQGYARKLNPNRYRNTPALLPDGTIVDDPIIIHNDRVPSDLVPENDAECDVRFPYIDSLSLLHKDTRILSNQLLFEGDVMELNDVHGGYGTHNIDEFGVLRLKPNTDIFKFVESINEAYNV